MSGGDTPGAPGKLDGLRILVADDDDDVREAIQIALESEGAKVLAVGDGQSALHELVTGAWSAVVLDMMLPAFSGLALAEELGTKLSSPPIVMITANQGQRHREYALGHGVKIYLQKPVALSRLVDALVRVAR